MGQGQPETESGPVRWFFRLAIPSAMVGWSVSELYTIWQAGYIWAGLYSVLVFFVGLAGFLWLMDDLPAFIRKIRGK